MNVLKSRMGQLVMVAIAVTCVVVAHMAQANDMLVGAGLIGMTAAAGGAETVTLAVLDAAFKANHKQLIEFIEKASGEIKTVGNVSNETKAAMEKLATLGNELGKRIDAVEAKYARSQGGGDSVKSLGQIVVENDEIKAMMSGRYSSGSRARVAVKQIINATGQNQPLVPAQRIAGIQAEPQRRLRVRDLLPVGRTSSNLIEYTKEDVFTNNAGPQNDVSPGGTEGAKKNKSNITFTLATAAVVTLAHYIKASKQVLADAPQLQSYIDSRLMYGLLLEEEDELLNGDGTAGQLNGLWNQATNYNRSADTNETFIDKLRKAITQVQLSEYEASGIVLHPLDWEAIELQKDSQQRYIWANPKVMGGPQLWGLPVVPTQSMPAGRFIVGAFDLGAQIWDREDASVQVGFENDDFTRNLVTILAEERLAFTVYRALAFVKGTK